MPTKKADQKAEATERVVDVTVPSGSGITVNVNDIYKAALSAVRDEIPLRSDLVHEIVGSDNSKKGDERTYQVRISWGPHDAAPRESDPQDGDFVAAHLDALEVPTALPVTTESDASA